MVTVSGQPDPHGVQPETILSPEEFGFSRAGLERAFRFLQDEISAGSIPGAVVAIGRGRGIAALTALGWASLFPEKEPMTTATVFDLASLTKVVATTPAALLLLERGAFRLDDPVQLFLPDFTGGNREAVRIRHLLTHTSGLPAFVHLFNRGLSRQEIMASIHRLELTYPPGTDVVYSDLGFILLTEVIEKITGQRLDQFTRREVFAPLGLEDTGFLPLPPSAARADRDWLRQPHFAATEYRADWGRYVRGEVHDENANAMEGVSGHAGLFSTAADLARYARLWLAEGKIPDQPATRLLAARTVAEATRNHTEGLREARGLGWVIRGRENSSGGDLLSSRAYGHTGFTGTSLWIDPELDLFVVLLTNRVHLGRDNTAILRLRPRFHNLVVAALA